ncbi:MAG TPA: E3 ubiquitin ligase family protein [Roseiflexaceae bacterium]|nr:E3 ubiquitin ligase family protein [Roseiflexaceae bacterium]
MGYIVFGIILLVVGGLLFMVSRNEKSKLAAMTAADTYTTQMLADLHQRVTAGVGADALAQPVEVAGTIECDTPLTGPVSGKPCVAYTYTVSREYEEDVTEKNDEGKTVTTTKKSSETEKHESQRVPFYIRDDAGRVLLLPDGAELDMLSAGERFDHPASSGGRVRTLGWRHTEKALPVGTRVFVLGTAVDHQGAPAIAKNPKGGQFIVSRKTEQELASDTQGSAKGFNIAAIVSAAIGLVLVVVGLINR